MTRALIVMFLLLIATPAEAVACKSSRGDARQYWAWRQIDGKRCWYVGQRGMSKARLHWASVSSRKRRARPPVRIAPDIWPAPSTFGKR
jgi:hypothetical protein